MPYRIKRSEKVPEAVRRIALEQIDRARSELRDTNMEAAESVHQARKRLRKRWRTYWRNWRSGT